MSQRSHDHSPLLNDPPKHLRLTPTVRNYPRSSYPPQKRIHFTRRSMEHASAPVPPADPEPVPVFPQQRLSKSGHNPFLAFDKPDIGQDKTVLPTNVSNHGRLPPPLPRKPALLAAPLRRPSESVPTPSTLTMNTTPSGPPLVPMKPTHVLSPLMRQSLEASKHAQSMKRAEEQLDRERVLQVLKTSSSSSSASNTSNARTRTRSLSPSKQVQKPPNGYAPGSGSEGSDDTTCTSTFTAATETKSTLVDVELGVVA
ncbi:hypothetical protein J3R82DRAFT_6353 [Butyriboletus roseoflavus]|nr:hypothetical protein J3R82DRAFT_6353 [Butyriboletus roseoflavus]